MLAHFMLSFTLFLTAISVGTIVISSNMKPISKIIVVAILSLSGMMTYRALNDVYGYPIVMQTSFDDALVISHLLDKENKVIHVWLKADGDKTPRSYTIPFSTKTAKFLEGMRQKHQGKPYRVEVQTETRSLSPLDKSVEEVEFGELIVLPPKTR